MIPAPPPPPRVTEPPSLCSAGPCRHYHRIESQMDSAAPLDGSGADMHPQITRACYPAAGIELELGETPVLRCSRWEPDNEQERLDSIRDTFLRSDAGREFAEALAAYDEEIALQQRDRDNAWEEERKL